MSYDLTMTLRSLPPLPVLAQEILMTVIDDYADLATLTAKISREPGIAGRVVGIANSALFTGLRPVLSIEGAIVRLGLQRVRMLTMSALLAEQFDPHRCPPFKPERYWYHAIGTANCAARLARFDPELDPDTAYLAGLLHNIGVLLLASVAPRPLAEALTEREAAPERPLAELLRERLNTDHREAGQQLLASWGLPAEIAAAAGNGAGAFTEPQLRLLRIVRFCAQWTATDYAEPPDHDRPPLTSKQLEALAARGHTEREQLQAVARLLAARD